MIPTEFQENTRHEAHIFAFVCVWPFEFTANLFEWKSRDRVEERYFYVVWV